MISLSVSIVRFMFKKLAAGGGASNALDFSQAGNGQYLGFF